MGKSNYGKCVLCGRTANRDSEGRCYHSKCKAARKAPVEHLVDPLEMRECPEPGRDEMPAAAAIQGDAEAVSGRGEPFEKIEELPGKDVQGAGALNASFDTPSQEQPAGNTGKGTCKVAGPCDDHISQPGKMVPGEKDSATLDTTRPFTLAGFDFEPDFYEPPAVPPTVRLSASGNLHFSSSAYATFGLRQFGFAKVLPDRSRQALCIVLSTTGGDGYHRLSTGSKCLRTPKVSVRHVFRGCPALVGKRMLLKETGVPGAFVAVLDGEAA